MGGTPLAVTHEDCFVYNCDYWKTAIILQHSNIALKLIAIKKLRLSEV